MITISIWGLLGIIFGSAFLGVLALAIASAGRDK